MVRTAQNASALVKQDCSEGKLQNDARYFQQTRLSPFEAGDEKSCVVMTIGRRRFHAQVVALFTSSAAEADFQAWQHIRVEPCTPESS